MESSKVSDLVRKYFAAYESKDRKVVEDTLSDSFTFTSPYDDHIGRRTYFDRCWSNSDKIRAIHIEKLVERGDDVFVLYTCELTTGTTFPIPSTSGSRAASSEKLKCTLARFHKVS
ncbi:MAG: nuclear transport factor 2 family protein [Burkholderiales bacterium]